MSAQLPNQWFSGIRWWQLDVKDVTTVSQIYLTDTTHVPLARILENGVIPTEYIEQYSSIMKLHTSCIVVRYWQLELC